VTVPEKDALRVCIDAALVCAAELEACCRLCESMRRKSESWIVWYMGIVDHQSGDSGILNFRVFHKAESRAHTIAYLQKLAVAERGKAKPTTRRRNDVILAVRQATIELLAESCRQ